MVYEADAKTVELFYAVITCHLWEFNAYFNQLVIHGYNIAVRRRDTNIALLLNEETGVSINKEVRNIE